MNTKRIITMLLCIMLLCVTFCGCSIDYNEFYDDDSRVGGNSTSYLSVGSVQRYSAGVLTYTAREFKGCKDVSSIYITGEETFEYTLSVTGGKFKVVLVDSNKVVTVIVESTGEAVNSSSHIHLTEGNYKLRIVGYDALGVDLRLEIEVGGH